MFAKSPQLVSMDRMLKRMKGIEINEEIYDQEFISKLEQKAKDQESETDYKVNIKRVLESEKSKFFVIAARSERKYRFDR
jgi:hypothetical protein